MARPILSARRAAVIAGTVVALAAIGGGLYAGSRPDNSAGGACAAARETARRLAPLARGEVAGFEVRGDPRPAPDLAFAGPDGAPMRLADLRGRSVLVNLWATWCAPCRAEMPALAALQRAFGGPGFEVATINLDTRNLDRPRAWLKANGVEGLTYYSDPAGRLLPALQRAEEGDFTGLPTSLLVDPAGCTVAVLRGPAPWEGPDATQFLRAALRAPGPAERGGG